jgi:pimeloyl-ACP methyl ester carboxylesterase
MPYVETPDGINLHYVDEGPRTAAGLFLIHPGPFSLELWRHNLPVLACEFRVLAMDVRGHGKSGKTGDGHSFGQYARDARYLAQCVGLEKFVAVGWSLGGTIFWSYMQQFGQDSMLGYVNVDQMPFRFVSEMQFRQRMINMTTRRLSYHREIIRAFIGPEMACDEELVSWMTYECMNVPTAFHAAIWDEVYHTDYRPMMASVRIPAAVFWAKYGNISADMAAEMKQTMNDARLVRFNHSGHLFPWLEAEKFNSELADFARGAMQRSALNLS